MASTGDVLRKADAPLDTGKPTVPPPPRPTGPNQGARADVTIRAEKGEKAHVDINTGKAAGGGWPKDADEWKSWLAKAAPWLIGAAIIAVAGASAYKKRDEESATGVRRKARAAGDRLREAGEEAREGARRGWFGLKSRARDAADEAEDAWEDTKSAAARKGKEAKEGAKGLVGRAEDAAHSAASAVGHKAHDVKEGAKSVAHSAYEGAHHAANRVEHGAAKVGSKVIEKEGAAQEATGRAMKEAGAHLEKDGRQVKQWARGEETKQEVKKRCSIM